MLADRLQGSRVSLATTLGKWLLHIISNYNSLNSEQRLVVIDEPLFFLPLSLMDAIINKFLGKENRFNFTFPLFVSIPIFYKKWGCKVFAYKQLFVTLHSD